MGVSGNGRRKTEMIFPLIEPWLCFAFLKLVPFGYPRYVTLEAPLSLSDVTDPCFTRALNFSRF